MKTFQVYLDLFYEIDTTDQNNSCKAEASSLLTLGLTTVSYDSDSLKKIGFDIILSIIDLLSQVSDAVKDDEDEEEDQKF